MRAVELCGCRTGRILAPLSVLEVELPEQTLPLVAILDRRHETPLDALGACELVSLVQHDRPGAGLVDTQANEQHRRRSFAILEPALGARSDG
jgi:hypothetical protein